MAGLEGRIDKGPGMESYYLKPTSLPASSHLGHEVGIPSGPSSSLSIPLGSLC